LTVRRPLSSLRSGTKGGGGGSIFGTWRICAHVGGDCRRPAAAASRIRGGAGAGGRRGRHLLDAGSVRRQRRARGSPSASYALLRPALRGHRRPAATSASLADCSCRALDRARVAGVERGARPSLGAQRRATVSTRAAFSRAVQSCLNVVSGRGLHASTQGRSGHRPGDDRTAGNPDTSQR
jgi:hypothetical protein